MLNCKVLSTHCCRKVRYLEREEAPVSQTAGEPTKQLGRLVQCEVLADDAIKLHLPALTSRRGRDWDCKEQLNRVAR